MKSIHVLLAYSSLRKAGRAVSNALNPHKAALSKCALIAMVKF